MEKPVGAFLQIVLAISELEKDRTGIDPLLSRKTYDYALPAPAGWDYRRCLEASAELQDNMSVLGTQRSGYIRRLLRAIDIICRVGMGQELSYQEKVRGCLELEIDRIPQSDIDKLAAELSDCLGKRGFAGELAAAVAEWKADTTITDTEELQRVADGFLQQSIDRTNERVLPVPEELDIEISFPKNFPYNGYSESSKNYVSRIMLSGDIGWPRAALKHLVTHEALPGHTLYYATKEKLYRSGKLDVEGTVYLANTPVSPLGEGLCEIGQAMLGMIEDDDDRIYDLLNRLTSAIITNAAIDYNSGSVSKAHCLKEMKEKAFVTELQAEKRFGFFSHPLWYISFMHYWFGRAIVHDCFMKMQNNLEMFYGMAYLKAQTIRGLQEDVDHFLKDSRQ